MRLLRSAPVPLVTAVVVLAPILATGCDDGTDAGGVTQLRRMPSSAAHDPNDVQGATTPDPGNPNATSSPAAPTTAGTPSTELAVTLAENTPSIGLGETLDLDVTVEPKNGFTGPVTLTVTGLPDGVTAAPAQANVGAGPTSAKVTLTARYDTVVSAPGASSPVVVTASAAGGSATANASLKVAPRVKLVIPVNVDALRAASVAFRDEWGAAFGSNPQTLRTQPGNGIVVTVFNADSKSHIIHGASGFAHGDTNNPIAPNAFEMQNGAPRTRTLTIGTDCMGYPHDGNDGVGASFRIKVDAAP